MIIAAGKFRLQALQNYASRDRCTVRLRHQEKKHIPLNSYVSLYEEGDASEENKRPPLIDTIQPDRENNPEELFLNKEYFRQAESMLKEQLSDLENRVLYLHLLGTEYQTIAKLIGKSPQSSR